MRGSPAAYRRAIAALKLKCPGLERAALVGGGAPPGGFFSGGDDAAGFDPLKEMREYQLTLAARTKEQVVRELARALSKVGVRVEPDAELPKVAAALRESLPDPRKGKTFSDQAAKQEKVCRAVAEALNTVFTPNAKTEDQLVDTSLSPVGICLSVAEWAHSFASGPRLEFQEVIAGLRRALQNLTALEELMKRLYDQVSARGKTQAKGPDAEMFETFNALYLSAEKERKRQVELIRNMFDVTLGPAARELETLYGSADEDDNFVHRLNLEPGAKGSGDWVARALGLMGSAAVVSQRVHEALKTIGMSLREYTESPDFTALEQTLERLLEKKPKGELGEMLVAAETLREHFGRRKEVKPVETTGGENVGGGAPPGAGAGSASSAGGSSGAGGVTGADGGTAGGLDAEEIDRREKKRKAEFDAIAREFTRRMDNSRRGIARAIMAIAGELGTGIPLSEKTEALRAALVDLKAHQGGDDMAMIGFLSTAIDRETRSEFLEALARVAAAAADLASGSGPAQSLGSSLRDAVTETQKAIDMFASAVRQRIGGAEYPSEVYPQYDISEAIDRYYHRHFVAKIRSNLASAAKEMPNYNERYESILGAAVAARITDIETQKATMKPIFTDATKKKVRDEFIDDMQSTRRNFYTVVQAVDLYALAFTDAIVASPDDCRDIKRMLDGYSVIAQWYTAKTGDDLAKAFDCMRSVALAADNTHVEDNNGNFEALWDQPGEHYYTKVATSDGIVGWPDAPMFVDEPYVTRAKGSVKAAVESFRALKNLVAAFTHLGQRFGGADFADKIFLRPIQIFHGLSEYLSHSALELYENVNGGQDGALPVRAGTDTAVTVANDYSDQGLVYFGMIGDKTGDGHVPQKGTSGTSTFGNYSTFAIEDELFALVMKTMVAKVFTAIGMFEAFERSPKVTELSPVRVVLGGAPTTEVEPKAAELYFRLPRLVEIYKTILGDKTRDIGLVPDLSTPFGRLFALIFVKSGDNYTESEARDVIQEITAIFRARGGKTKEIVEEVVSEVNRRYGIVSAKDWEAFDKTMGRPSPTIESLDQPFILPGEGVKTVAGLAPSERYAPLGAAAPGSASKVQWAPKGLALPQHENIVGIAQTLETLVNQLSPAVGQSFGRMITLAEEDMERARGAEQRFVVALRLLQSSATLMVVSRQTLLALHETVTVHLSALWMLQRLCAEIEAVAIETDVPGAFAFIDRWMDDWKTPRVEDALHNNTVQFFEDLKARKVAITYEGNPARNANFIDQANRAEKDVTAAADIAKPVGLFITQLGGLVGGIGGDGMAELVRRVAYKITGIAGVGGRVQVDATAAHKDAALDKGKKLAKRYLIDSQKILRKLLAFLAMLHSTGFAEIRFVSGENPITIDLSRIRLRAEEHHQAVRRSLSKLRSQIPKSLMDDLEHNGEMNLSKVELFFDEFFTAKASTTGFPSKTKIETIANQFQRTLAMLVEDTKCNAAHITPQIIDTGVIHDINFDDPTDVALNKPQYGDVFFDLAYYTAYWHGGQSPLLSGLVSAAGAPAISKLITNVDAKGVLEKPTSSKRDNSKLVAVTVYDSVGAHLSAVFAFNSILAEIIRTMSDATNFKIYQNLILGLTNGPIATGVNTALENSKTIQDIVGTANTPFGARGDLENPSYIILQSLAAILQRLTRDMSKAGAPLYLVSTLTDVPLYMKETMRARLPFIARRIENLIRHIEFIRSATGVFPLARDGPARAVKLGGMVAQNPASGKIDNLRIAAADSFTPIVGIDDILTRGGLDSSVRSMINPYVTRADVQSHIRGVLDNVTTAASTLLQSIADVMKELVDQPMFGAVSENSIAEYRRRNGRDPIAPVSFIFAPFANGAKSLEGDYGTAPFKLAYCLRGALAQLPGTPFEAERIPTAMHVLEEYNRLAPAPVRFDPGDYRKYVALAVETLRSLYPTVIPIMRPAISFSIMTDKPSIVQPLVADAQTLVEMIESPDQETSLDSFLTRLRVIGAAAPTSREVERVNNLIDMNIVPINLNAMRRHIPLVNLYIYAHAFDRFSENMLTSRMDAAKVFLSLLQNPFVPFKEEEYGSDVLAFRRDTGLSRLLRGDDGLGLGLPRFLSDQLYEKVLFRSFFPRGDVGDVSGPAFATGVAQTVPGHLTLLQRFGTKIAALVTALDQGGIATYTAAATNVAINTASQAVLSAQHNGGSRLGGQVYDIDARITAIEGAITALKTDPMFPQRSRPIRDIAIGNIRYAVQQNLEMFAGLLDEIIGTITVMKALVAGIGQGPGDAIAKLARSKLDMIAIRDLLGLVAGNAGADTIVLPISASAATASYVVTVGGTDYLNLQAIDELLDDTITVGTSAEELAQSALPSVGVSELGYRAKDGTPKFVTIVPKTDLSNARVKGIRQLLEDCGRHRFNTRLVRKLVFITLLQRLVRLKLNRELVQKRKVMSASDLAVAPRVTEFGHDAAPNATDDE